MTNAELAILSLIIEEPRHGYQIEQVIEGRGMRNWTDVGFSSIYYLLKKLEDKGLISADQQQPKGQGPARKVYHATQEGYQEWYHQALETLRTPVRQPVPFLLGLSVLPAFKPKDAREALQTYISDLEKRREELVETAERQRPLPPHVAAMFDYSAALMDAEINWMKTFIAEMDA